MTNPIDRRTLENLVQGHEAWRGQCINLTPSENALSPAVRRYLNSDLVQRYGDYNGRDLRARKYQGTRYIEELDRCVIELACEVYGARCAELRPLSGHVAGAAVIMALTKPGDLILELPPEGGSHRMATKLAMAQLAQLDVRFLPFDAGSFNVDVAGAVDMIRSLRPRMVILGSSAFLFPHPVRELAEALRDDPEAFLVYDGSHVLGLMAGGRFQQPLGEGAHLVFGSTHKTLPGPQGGLILTDDESLMERIVDAVYPGLVTNHHLFRLPALGTCLLEMREFGEAYAGQIIANAGALGEALTERGIEMVRRLDGRFTDSHTLLIRSSALGPAKALADRLEAANIIVSTIKLPAELGSEGLRIGAQEITRLGAGEGEMAEIAGLLAGLLLGDVTPAQALPGVKDFAVRFQTHRFTWSAGEGMGRV